MNASGRNTKEKSNENKQSVWTGETIGVILVLFATLCMVCLITRDAVFSYPGKWVNSFLFGCFGYFSYLVIIYVAVAGVIGIIGKKTGLTGKKKAFMTLSFVLLALFTQILSMRSLTEVGSSISYSDYLATAYKMGEGGIATASAAGLITSFVSYFLATLLTNVGSCVVVGILFAISLYFTVKEFFGTPSKEGKKTTAKAKAKAKANKFRGSFVKNETVDTVETDGVNQPSSGRARLFVTSPEDFEIRSKRDIAKDKNDYDVSMEYSGNGLTVAHASVETEAEKKQPTYTDDFKEKLDYIKTPSAINVESIKNDTYTPPTTPYYNREEMVSGTTVSDYVKPREESSYDYSTAIPHAEHEETSSYSTDTAENNAERFSRYADTIDFSGGRISTTEPTEGLRSFGSDSVVESEMKTETIIPMVEETVEEEVSQAEPEIQVEPEISVEPEVQTFEVKDEPTPSILGARRVRNIFSEEPEIEIKEEEPSVPVQEEPEVEPIDTTPTPSFTSRVGADNNFGARRSIFGDMSLENKAEQKSEPEPEPVKEKKPIPINRRYNKPPLDLLETREVGANAPTDDHNARMEIIQKTLEEFHINAVPQSFVQGPSITRYEIMMPAGISVKKVLNYDDDLKMRLAVRDGVRIEAPIPGKNLVGIEVANSNKVMVGLKEVMQGLAGKKVKESALMFALGKDIVGNSISDDLAKGPHYLIAGATGSGKSVALHVMIVSLLMRYSPEELKLVLVDPKSVEFRKYEHIPHLLVDEIVTEPKRALALLQWAYDETNRRNAMFTECGGMISNIEDYNTHIAGPTVAKLPRIVFVIDELADLMEACKKDLETRIRMIAAKSRSAGIHLVLATQRPSVDVITGTIKANLPSRIALKVMNYPDSQTILGEGGAEKLLGNGDMLYKNSSMADYERYQGAYISGKEISTIVDYIKENNKAYFDDDVQDFLDKETKPKTEEKTSGEDGGDNGSEINELFLQALWLAVNSQSASISQFQRRFGIGYAKAGGLIDKMERFGFVSGNEGSKARRVLISKEEYESRFGTPPETF